MINLLIRVAAVTASITTLAALAAAIAQLTSGTTHIFILFYQIMPSFYACSLLVTLNSRRWFASMSDREASDVSASPYWANTRELVSASAMRAGLTLDRSCMPMGRWETRWSRRWGPEWTAVESFRFIRWRRTSTILIRSVDAPFSCPR